jgi:ABC-type transport system substrate-binding protein
LKGEAAGRFDLALAGGIADTPDPADFYEALLWSKRLSGENHANNSRWNHAPTDAALLRFRSDPSEDNRGAIQAIMTSEVPFVPLVYGHTTVVHSRRLRRVPISPVRCSGSPRSRYRRRDYLSGSARCTRGFGNSEQKVSVQHREIERPP